MKPESKKALDAIFQKHEAARKLADHHAERALSQKEETFLARFYSVRASILRPRMQEFGEYVKSRGYDYEIDEQDERVGGEPTNSGSIAIHFITNREAGRSIRECPTFIFSCESSHERVRLFESTVAPGGGGHSGTVGEVPLAELTPDFVERQLLALAKHAFA